MQKVDCIDKKTKAKLRERCDGEISFVYTTFTQDNRTLFHHLNFGIYKTQTEDSRERIISSVLASDTREKITSFVIFDNLQIFRPNGVRLIFLPIIFITERNEIERKKKITI